MASTSTCEALVPAATVPPVCVAPSGVAASGRAAGSAVPTAALSVPSLERSEPDPRIDNRIANIGDKVADHRDYADQDGDAEHDLVVVAQRGLVVLETGPRVVEHLLDDQRPGEHERDGQAHERDHRDQRVAEQVPHENESLGQSFGSGGPDVVRG